MSNRCVVVQIVIVHYKAPLGDLEALLTRAICCEPVTNK